MMMIVIILTIASTCVAWRRVSGCVLRRLTSRVEEESDETGEKAKKTPRQEEDDDDDHGQKKHTKSQLEVKMISFKTFWYIVRVILSLFRYISPIIPYLNLTSSISVTRHIFCQSQFSISLNISFPSLLASLSLLCVLPLSFISNLHKEGNVA